MDYSKIYKVNNSHARPYRKYSQTYRLFMTCIGDAKTSIPAKILQSSKMALVRAFLQPEKANTKKIQLKKSQLLHVLILNINFCRPKLDSPNLEFSLFGNPNLECLNLEYSIFGKPKTISIPFKSLDKEQVVFFIRLFCVNYSDQLVVTCLW